MKRTVIFLFSCVLLLVSGCMKYAADRMAADPMAEVLAIATLRQDDTVFFLQVSDTESVEVINPEAIHFKPDTRCMVRYYIVSRTPNPPRSVVARVEWMEAIVTFDLSVAGGSASYDSPGGETEVSSGRNDPAPLEIRMDSWMTALEDGFLTLHYNVMSSGGKAHRFVLVQGMNPQDPYELHLEHYLNGDAPAYLEEGLVAFRLDGLPDTKGATVPLTLKYKSLNDSAKGEASVRFDYRTRK
jgi:hypothetical protein